MWFYHSIVAQRPGDDFLGKIEYFLALITLLA